MIQRTKENIDKSQFSEGKYETVAQSGLVKHTLQLNLKICKDKL